MYSEWLPVRVPFPIVVIGHRHEDEYASPRDGGDRIIIGKRSCSREEVAAALGSQLNAMPGSVREQRRFPLGTYRGLRFGMVLHPQFAPEVYLEGKVTRLDTLSRDHHGPRAVLNALDRLTGGYASDCVRVQKELGITESQLRDYRARLGSAFLHEGYLAELTGLRDRLKAALSGDGRDSEAGSAESASEPAQSIKNLNAGQTIDSSPQRLGQVRLSAEVPVTARILRKLEAGADSGIADTPA
jgi:hypothetical protein